MFIIHTVENSWPNNGLIWITEVNLSVEMAHGYYKYYV